MNTNRQRTMGEVVSKGLAAAAFLAAGAVFSVHDAFAQEAAPPDATKEVEPAPEAASQDVPPPPPAPEFEGRPGPRGPRGFHGPGRDDQFGPPRGKRPFGPPPPRHGSQFEGRGDFGPPPPHHGGRFGGRGDFGPPPPHHKGQFEGRGQFGPPPPHHGGRFEGRGQFGPPPRHDEQFRGRGDYGPPPHPPGQFRGRDEFGPPPHARDEQGPRPRREFRGEQVGPGDGPRAPRPPFADRPDPNELFDRIDANGDGQISKEEFQSFRDRRRGPAPQSESDNE